MDEPMESKPEISRRPSPPSSPLRNREQRLRAKRGRVARDEFQAAKGREELMQTVDSFLKQEGSGLGTPDEARNQDQSILLSAVDLFLKRERAKLKAVETAVPKPSPRKRKTKAVTIAPEQRPPILPIMNQNEGTLMHVQSVHSSSGLPTEDPFDFPISDTTTKKSQPADRPVDAPKQHMDTVKPSKASTSVRNTPNGPRSIDIPKPDMDPAKRTNPSNTDSNLLSGSGPVNAVKPAGVDPSNAAETPKVDVPTLGVLPKPVDAVKPNKDLSTRDPQKAPGETAIDESKRTDETKADGLSISGDHSQHSVPQLPPVVHIPAHSSSDSVIPYRVIAATTTPDRDDSSESLCLEVPSPRLSSRQERDNLNNNSEPILEEAQVIADDFRSDTEEQQRSRQSKNGSYVMAGQISEIHPFEIESLRIGSLSSSDPKSARLSLTGTGTIPPFSIVEQPPSTLSEIPVFDRLRMYAQNHLRLSLSLPNGPSEKFMKYIDAVETAPSGKYAVLTEDETVVVWSVLEKMHSGTRREIFDLVSRDIGESKRSPIVNKIATNILTFLA
jgi:hypothetical protein